MWADTLLALERGHLLRLTLWGAGCVTTGALLLALLRWRHTNAPLLRHFAIQVALWGAFELVFSQWGMRTVSLRDLAGAQQLVNFLWLNTGLDAGYILTGVTLTLTSWRLGTRLAGMGAGAAIALHGLALLLLDVGLITLIGPLQ